MSSGIENVTVAEARGLIAPPPPIDASAVIFGNSSAGAVGLSGPYSNVAALNAAVGYGPGPTACAYAIDEYQIPVWFYRSANTNAGTYGTTDVSGIAGTASTHFVIGPSGAPFNDYNVAVRAVGAAVLGTNCKIQVAIDGGLKKPVTWSATINIGVALTYTIPNTGIVITLGQAADTFADGDVGYNNAIAPKWAAADIDTAAAANGALCQTTYEYAHLYFAGPCSATEAGHVTTLLSTLKNVGKIVDAVIHTRGPIVSSAESETTWAGLVETDFAGFNDDRIQKIEGHPTVVIDPTDAKQWQRTWAYAYFARMLASERNTWVGCPDDGGFVDPNSGTTLVQLYDASGALVGHDEGPSGNVTGMSDAAGLGNRFTCLIRGQTQSTRKIAYTTVPWVAYQVGGGGRVFTFMQRRIAQAIERDALDVSFASLGGTAFFDTDPNTQISTLQLGAKNAIHHIIFAALTGDKYAEDIENSADDDADTGLVQVNPVVSVAPGNLVSIAVTLAPKIAGKILSIALTYAAQ